MKIILLDNIRGVGQIGDVKDVSDGYGRNFLLPRGKGKLVTDRALKEVADLKVKKLQLQTLEHTQSVEIARKLASITLTLTGKANEKGTLFSSISESDIAEQLSAKVGTRIPASAIVSDGHIKNIGTHTLRVQLADDVSSDLTVEITPS